MSARSAAGRRARSCNARVVVGSRLVCVAAAVTFAGCASPAGLAEYRAYSVAFDRAGAASNAILDDLAAAERETALAGVNNEQDAAAEPTAEVRRTSQQTIEAFGFDPEFYVADAIYSAEGRDPPSVAAYRRALAVVAEFNEVALGYAEGRALAELKRRVGALGIELDASRAGFALAVGSAAAPPAALIGPILSLIGEGVEAALQAPSREVFREVAREQAPHIDRMLVVIRDTTPAMFTLITSNLRAEARSAAIAGLPEAAKPAIRSIENYRRLLSTWVVLLEDARSALGAAVAAMDAPRGSERHLSDLTESTIDLRERTARIRTLLVQLRRGESGGTIEAGF